MAPSGHTANFLACLRLTSTHLYCHTHGMVDAPLRLLACVLPATALSQGRGYGSTSAATKTIVSGLTQLVNLNGGAKPANKKRPRRFASLTPQQVKAGLADDFRNEYLWSGRITPELYDEACVFTDPTLSFRGLDVFEANLRNLDPWIERFVPSERRRVDLYALAVDGAAITASWRMVGTLALPWRPRLDLNGTTTYTLNGAGAPSAFVTNPGPRPNLFLRRRRPHFLLRRDVGALGGRGPVAALDTGGPGSRGNRRAGVLARPARGPGADPEGARAARESADGRGPAGSGAGAFVRYEFAPTAPRAGFGNDAADYATPLGRPEETGLAALLARGLRTDTIFPINHKKCHFTGLDMTYLNSRRIKGPKLWRDPVPWRRYHRALFEFGGDRWDIRLERKRLMRLRCLRENTGSSSDEAEFDADDDELCLTVQKMPFEACRPTCNCAYDFPLRVAVLARRPRQELSVGPHRVLELAPRRGRARPREVAVRLRARNLRKSRVKNGVIYVGPRQTLITRSRHLHPRFVGFYDEEL